MKKNNVMKLQKKKRRRKRMENNNVQKLVSLGTGTKDPKKLGKEPEVASRLVFTFYETNPPSVRVEGIPSNLQAALRQVNAATELVVRMFVDKGKSGLLDNQYNILEENPIIPVSTPILGPDGKKLN